MASFCLRNKVARDIAKDLKWDFYNIKVEADFLKRELQEVEPKLYVPNDDNYELNQDYFIFTYFFLPSIRSLIMCCEDLVNTDINNAGFSFSKMNTMIAPALSILNDLPLHSGMTTPNYKKYIEYFVGPLDRLKEKLNRLKSFSIDSSSQNPVNNNPEMAYAFCLRDKRIG